MARHRMVCDQQESRLACNGVVANQPALHCYDSFRVSISQHAQGDCLCSHTFPVVGGGAGGAFCPTLVDEGVQHGSIGIHSGCFVSGQPKELPKLVGLVAIYCLPPPQSAALHLSLCCAHLRNTAYGLAKHSLLHYNHGCAHIHACKCGTLTGHGTNREA